MLLVWPWVHLFGADELGLRSLSLLFAAAAVPPLFFLSRRLSGSARLATFTSFLLATNGTFLEYAQEGRGYSLVIFLACLSTCALFRAVETRERRWWRAYVAAGAALSFAHVVAVFLLFAHGVALRLHADWAQLRRAVLRAFAALAGVGLIHSWLIHAERTARVSPVDWIHPATFGGVLDTLIRYAGFTGVGLAVYLLALVPFVRSLTLRPAVGGPEVAWERLVVMLWLVVPLGLLFPISVFVKPLWVPRYELFTLPAWLLALGCGIGLAGPSRRRALLASLAVAVNFGSLYIHYGPHGKGRSDWQGVYAFLKKEMAPEDIVFFARSWSARPFRYYVNKGQRSGFTPTIMSDAPTDMLTEQPRIWAVKNMIGEEEMAPIRRRLETTHLLVKEQRFEAYEHAPYYEDPESYDITVYRFDRYAALR
jgi:mannosyltransferase